MNPVISRKVEARFGFLHRVYGRIVTGVAGSGIMKCALLLCLISGHKDDEDPLCGKRGLEEGGRVT